MSVVTRRDLWFWQDKRTTKGGRPKAASLVSCHNRDLALSQQISCLATAHIFSCRTRYPSRQERLREWTNQIQGSLPRPDFSGTHFIFFEIGDWEIVIVKKIKNKMISPPPAHPKSKWAPTPTRRSSVARLNMLAVRVPFPSLLLLSRPLFTLRLKMLPPF